MSENVNIKQIDSHEIISYTNPDYPVGVYYVEPSKMYMQHVRWHWHEELEINYVKEGSATFHIGDEQILLTEGQAVLINQDVLHSIHNAEHAGCVILSVMFHPNFLFHVPDSATSLMYLNPIVSDPSFRYLYFERKDIWSRGMLSMILNLIDVNLAHEFGYELMTKSILSEFWFQLIKKMKLQYVPNTASPKALSPDQNRIKDAILYIEEHFAETITLDDIADSIHVSKSECCRCFKRAVGLTPFEYLMKYRILKAAERILTNDKSAASISNLAVSVGFNNTSYFNKLFKEYFDCTPLQYRKLSKTEHRDKLSAYGLSLTHI